MIHEAINQTLPEVASRDAGAPLHHTIKETAQRTKINLLPITQSKRMIQMKAIQEKTVKLKVFDAGARPASRGVTEEEPLFSPLLVRDVKQKGGGIARPGTERPDEKKMSTTS